MQTTARFDLERRRQLKTLFTRDRLTRLWRGLVKDQMRAMDIRDLHDYYDFNYVVESRADAIVEKVLSGQYRAEAPLIYRDEKMLGICRHLMIPSPSDALVFQLVTDVLHGPIMRAQPSKGAYYARARHNLALPHEHRQAGSYPWFLLWPKFQKEIWNFSKFHKLLVTTDLSNYFDNIGLRELRHVISAIAKTKEVYLDLLFSLIEDLSWNPDYLPTSLKGLPTINIEAPRLLAHALLFEVDYVLKKKTKGNFVRWMDDINFGVSNVRDANLILGEISDVLKSRGLALNLSKTGVMAAKDVKYHFLFKENVRLTRVDKRARKLKGVHSRRDLAKKTGKELASHLNHCTARNKDKVTKRFLTILTVLRVPVALGEARNIFSHHPALRRSVLNYLARLPFSTAVAKAFVDLWDKTELYDDSTRFAFVEALVKWRIPFGKEGQRFVTKMKVRLRGATTGFDWRCHLLLLVKYGEPHEVLTVAGQGRPHGINGPFFARQRMAALPRGLGINRGSVLRQWRNEVSTGSGDSASVANNLITFADRTFPSKSDRTYFYLFPQSQQDPYPIAKFLLLCVVASSEAKSGKRVNRPEVAKHVRDPWFLHWLRLIHPAWF